MDLSIKIIRVHFKEDGRVALTAKINGQERYFVEMMETNNSGTTEFSL